MLFRKKYLKSQMLRTQRIMKDINGFRKGFRKYDNTISVQSIEDFTEDVTEDPSEALKIADVNGFRRLLNKEIAINLDDNKKTDKDSSTGCGFWSFPTPAELIELVPSLEVRPDWTYDEFWEYWTKWTTDNNYYLNTLNQSVDQKKSY
eukprot:786029_1